MTGMANGRRAELETDDRSAHVVLSPLATRISTPRAIPALKPSSLPNAGLPSPRLSRNIEVGRGNHPPLAEAIKGVKRTPPS